MSLKTKVLMRGVYERRLRASSRVAGRISMFA